MNTLRQQSVHSGMNLQGRSRQSIRGFKLLTLFLSVFGFNDALAEGTAQLGLNQHLLDAQGAIENNYKSDETSASLYVDILKAGEVINVSLCGDSESDQLSIEFFPPSNPSHAVHEVALDSANISCNHPLDKPLPEAIRFTTDESGPWRIVLQNHSHRLFDQSKFRRFDISVTDDASKDPDPTIAAGRLWAYDYSINATSFAKTDATDADLFVLVPGGRPDTSYVWKLDLNKFAGFGYNLFANAVGVDSPNSGYSTPIEGNEARYEFPVYLGNPAIAKPRPTEAAVLTDVQFSDSDNSDFGISPANADGVQDYGTFSFTSDVAGTYAISLDLDGDGNFGNANDVVLTGRVHKGKNKVTWDGKNTSNGTPDIGLYRAQISVHLGEYHFVAIDVETSGGDEPGLTIFAINENGDSEDTQVYWNDSTKLHGIGQSNLPFGANSSHPDARHTWGQFDSEGLGNENFIDTWVYGLVTRQTLNVAITEQDAELITDSDFDGDGLNDTLDNDDDNDGISDVDEGEGDFDNDSQPNRLDVDSDNDGLLDSAEGNADTDNDGNPNYLDLDSDADGIADSIENIVDSDGDSTPDFLDTDSDNDGISDADEGTNDSDDDGIPDYLDNVNSPPTSVNPDPTDSDNDTIIDAIENANGNDTDGDGIADSLDTDSDGDGIPDETEAGINPGNPLDTDTDGTPDYLDQDSDNDGLSDNIEGTADQDGDGVPNYLDLDSDNDGIPDSIESNGDADGDGVPNFLDTPSLDLDTDNDGIINVVEGLELDSDGDGQPDYRDTDSDNDGIPDAAEAGNPASPTDTDLDGLPDYRDTDSDNDTIPDAVEVGNRPNNPRDTDADGVPDWRDNDSDGDGIADLIEAGSTGSQPDNRDNDGIPDYRDLDSDNDGLSDGVEGTADTDNDGVPDRLDADSDNDGLTDAAESRGFNTDINGDGQLDDITDTNGNGWSDAFETQSALEDIDIDDIDGDGQPDHLDLDTDNDGIFDIIEVGGQDIDEDGRVDSIADADGDGIPDSVDVSVVGGVDQDGDGIVDTADSNFVPGSSDLDDDGIPDANDPDANGDGIPDILSDDGQAVQMWPDSDGNGVPDVEQNDNTIPVTADSDDDPGIYTGLNGGCSMGGPDTRDGSLLLLLFAALIGLTGSARTRNPVRTHQRS